MSGLIRILHIDHICVYMDKMHMCLELYVNLYMLGFQQIQYATINFCNKEIPKHSDLNKVEVFNLIYITVSRWVVEADEAVLVHKVI